MLHIKSVLVLAVLVQIAFAEYEVPLGMKDNKRVYDRLVNCVSTSCGKSYQIDSSDKSPYQACQKGCNVHMLLGKNCDGLCKDFTGDLKDACMKGCQFRQSNAEVKAVDPKPEQAQVPVDQKAVDPAVVPTDEKNAVQQPPKPAIADAAGSLKNDDDKKVDEPSGDIKDVIENLFKPFLINGVPGGPIAEINDNVDSTIIEIKPLDDDNDDSDSNSLESASKEDKNEPINTNDVKIEDPSDSSSLSIFSPFKIMDLVKSAVDKAREKFNGGNFVFYAKLLENGTILETYEKPLDDTDDNSDSDEPPFKILNALLGEHQVMSNIDSSDDHLPPGLHPNWKGRPLAIGKPIIEEIPDMPSPPYRMYRECKPIRFHFRTLCHDLNNFFTCASMRTGLPRWFFLSLMLLCSFFMLWLGIFIFSMIRKMKRQERVITLEEDQLPLYKDIVFEEKLPPAYTSHESIPEKVKLETA